MTLHEYLDLYNFRRLDDTSYCHDEKYCQNTDVIRIQLNDRTNKFIELGVNDFWGSVDSGYHIFEICLDKDFLNAEVVSIDNLIEGVHRVWIDEEFEKKKMEKYKAGD